MTKDDIIRMAREVSDVTEDSHGRESFGFDYYGLEAFANLVAAADREALRDEIWEKAMKLVSEAVKYEREACMNCYSPDDSAADWMDKMKARGQS